ncbi:pleckstrin domain-containing protein [Heterostelium album PN500]|uniref:Pleckstrin domain-containing protein n=1 Tax=Heterostelium pallidum (strain ATCC 26659 / Pp 5 / PN500) TaxID=670386 RepID=D3AXP2_HETP5|nr:pleckstrin domain-containing protein [Heterostelium album PN500]EFA85719.1 pleckstrin domain-containing protein [Heterostelium album PN500]|eukprot:XP_020437825.1 pleckstrin domain-containing protein [Heterostelium album PN500]
MGSIVDEKQKERIKELLKLPENAICADCGSPDVQWASINLGVFICIVCAGVHRHLGVHISRVKSANLDSWKESEVDMMESTNNEKANREIWEAALPPGFIKPTYGDSIGLKEQWIIAKYSNKSFSPPNTKDAKRINFEVKEGWIVKKGEVVKSWKKRWLRLIDGEYLYYYKGPTEKSHCGFISLRESGQIDSVSEVDSKPYCFIISTPKRRYLISCNTGEDMFRWIEVLRQAVINMPPGTASNGGSGKIPKMSY